MIYVKISELIKSDTADKYNIPNTPNKTQIDNMQALIYHILQPTREHFGNPLIVTSGFRSKVLNAKLKSLGYHPSETSQHCSGEAADFIVRNISLHEIVKFIAKNLQFDQLILEYDNNSSWVHVSYREGRNRKQIMTYRNGVYTNGVKDVE